ncbi:hypothetical protein [Desulfonatronum parangueonense]
MTRMEFQQIVWATFPDRFKEEPCTRQEIRTAILLQAFGSVSSCPKKYATAE